MQGLKRPKTLLNHAWALVNAMGRRVCGAEFFVARGSIAETITLIFDDSRLLNHCRLTSGNCGSSGWCFCFCGSRISGFT